MNCRISSMPLRTVSTNNLQHRWRHPWRRPPSFLRMHILRYWPIYARQYTWVTKGTERREKKSDDLWDTRDENGSKQNKERDRKIENNRSSLIVSLPTYLYTHVVCSLFGCIIHSFYHPKIKNGREWKDKKRENVSDINCRSSKRENFLCCRFLCQAFAVDRYPNRIPLLLFDFRFVNTAVTNE